MKRKWGLALLAVFLLGMLAAGCREKEKEIAATEPVETSGTELSSETETPEEPVTFELALITDGDTLETGCLNQSAWSGLVSFAEENGVSHRYYRPAGTSAADYAAAIDEAANGGARLIVCIGNAMEAAVLQKQSEYPQIDFLLVDGEPRGKSGAVLEKNVLAVRFQVDQSAYMAGYAAAVSGYRGVGFVGQADDEKSKRYCYGLLQGLNDGAARAADDGSSASTVVFRYCYLEDASEAAVAARMEEWSQGGITMVMAGTEELSTLCAQQSSGLPLAIVGAEMEQSANYSNVKASVMLDASASVYDACAEHLGDAFEGGTIAFYDTATGSVRLDVFDAAFVAFSPDDFRQLQEQLASGDIQINNDITVEIGAMDFPFVAVMEEKP